MNLSAKFALVGALRSAQAELDAKIKQLGELATTKSLNPEAIAYFKAQQQECIEAIDEIRSLMPR